MVNIHSYPAHGLSSLPLRAGIGLRSVHFKQIREERPDVGFLEIHPENFFGGGAHVEMLAEYAMLYPISFHGVGLSLGSAGALDKNHIHALKQLVERIQPDCVSDHVSWSASGNAHLPDLLPLPYTEETLCIVAAHIDEVQQTLGRKILVENPSTYLAFSHSTMSEPNFLAALVERTGCGLLVDVNNMYVQAHNVGANPQDYFSVLGGEWIGEIHLAGHTRRSEGEAEILIDTHDGVVCDEVWNLYEQAVAKWGAVPTLIEWDQRLPELDVLVGEAEKAERVMLALQEERFHAIG